MRVNLTAEQSISCLNEGDYIHVFINSGALIGADWKREEVVDLFNNAEHIEIGGEMCRSMKHGIVVFPKNAKYQSDLYFVECNDEKLSKYDMKIGEEND